jgi:hypothetical protein
MAEYSPLVEFYLGHTTAGVAWIHDIVPMPPESAPSDVALGLWTDEAWEMNHDFIQWLFPLKTPSNFNPDAPLLTDEDIAMFKSNNLLQQNVRQSFRRFLRFLGLNPGIYIAKGWVEGDEAGVAIPSYNPGYQIHKAANFESRKWIWENINHNWLRITRVIASLKLLGFDGEATSFFNCLGVLYNEGYGSPESFAYWQKAAEGLIE